MSVTDEILTAELKCADMTNKNVVALMGGNTQVNWQPIIKAQRGINVVANRVSLGDTTSVLFQKAYACMASFVGNYAGGAIDPNAQSPGTTIIITNPATQLPWAVIKYADFDPASQQPDGGRTTYLNTAWRGINPLLSLASPVETYLQYGVDYTLVFNGGIELSPGGNKPEIYDGEEIVVSNYKLS